MAAGASNGPTHRQTPPRWLAYASAEKCRAAHQTADVVPACSKLRNVHHITGRPVRRISLSPTMVGGSDMPTPSVRTTPHLARVLRFTRVSRQRLATPAVHGRGAGSTATNCPSAPRSRFLPGRKLCRGRAEPAYRELFNSKATGKRAMASKVSAGYRRCISTEVTEC
jgi:hypothetical protein